MDLGSLVADLNLVIALAIMVGFAMATVATAAGLAIVPKNCRRSKFFITSSYNVVIRGRV